MKPAFEDLEKKLLSIGGIRVVHQPEEDLESILVRGQIFKPKTIKLMPMKPNRCHGNAGIFWKNFSDANGFTNVQIVTGWCLSEDDLWRQHSFIYQPISDRIVETTTKRKIYFGFALDVSESLWFHENNW